MTEKKESSFEVSAALLHAVLPCAAKQDVRYYLNGVSVRPGKEGGAVIAATNGHIMALVFDPDGKASGDSIIDRDTVARLPKRGLVSLAAGVVKAGAVSYAKSVIDGTFPDPLKVLPAHMARGIAAEAIRLDYLRAAIDFFPRISGKSSLTDDTPEVYSNSPTGDVVFASRDRHALVAVMPARSEKADWALPTYLQNLP